MAYYKPQSPLEMNGNHIYPITTHDQIIMADGNRWDGKSLSNGGSVSGAIEATAFIENGVSLETKYTQVSTYHATLPAYGWSDSVPYTQTVSVQGILATDNPFVDVDVSSALDSDSGLAITEAWSFIGRITANEGTITAYCYLEKPAVNLDLILTVMR